MPLLALLAIWARGESPKIEHVLLEVFGVLLLFAAAAPPRAVCCMACWLGGAAGPRGIVRARLLCGGGCCRRWRTRSAVSAARGLPRRDGAGRERLPAPHGKPPQAVSRCVVGRFRDHRPATGRSTDFSAPLAVLAWLVVLVPVKILLNTLALRATRLSALDARRTGIALGHGGEFALLLLGTGLAAASDPRDRRPTHAGRAGAQYGPGTATDPPSRCNCRILEPPAASFSHPRLKKSRSPRRRRDIETMSSFAARASLA